MTSINIILMFIIIILIIALLILSIAVKQLLSLLKTIITAQQEAAHRALELQAYLQHKQDKEAIIPKAHQ